MVVEEVVDEVEHGDHVDHVLFDELAPTQFHQEFHSSCSHHPKSAHGFAMDGSGVQEGLGDVSSSSYHRSVFHKVPTIHSESK